MSEEVKNPAQEKYQEEFRRLVLEGKLEPGKIDPLIRLVSSGFCMHRSWGFGRITTVDTVLSKLVIDFKGKPNHPMDMGFASQTLKPIPHDHILARKASDLQNLKRTAAKDHLELIRMVLNSYDNKATLSQIQEALVPDIISDDWKKWWEAARKEMKVDGHFQMPVKKTEPIIYHAEELSLQDQLLCTFRNAKGLKAQLAAATELAKNTGDLNDKVVALGEVILTLNHAIKNHLNIKPGLALDAILVRDSIRELAGVPPVENEPTAEKIWAKSEDLAANLEALTAARQKLALESYKDSHPDTWEEMFLELINRTSTRLVGEIAEILSNENRFKRFRNTLALLVSRHEASSGLLLWLARERSDSFADILGPEVFRAMMSAIESDQFNEKKTSRLSDFILEDQDLIMDLIGTADMDVIKDMVRSLQQTTCFDDMDKRSLLARIVKKYPGMKSMISGDQPKEDTYLMVSWDSLERRKGEYENLVRDKIPANSKEIAVARSYGDLRENHEYKAAKEMQKILLTRKGELENDLARARGTDFSDSDNEQVGVGNRVITTNLDSGQTETFNILGAWDSNPDKGVVSYLTPLAQALLNLKPGQEAGFELGGEKCRYRVETIERFVPSEMATPST